MARRIIAYRESRGPFRKIEDIKRVKGIGDATFERLKDLITVH
jgi:competence protein ComEA